MNTLQERTKELIQRAEALGLKLRASDGLVIVKVGVTADSYRQLAVIKELGDSLKELRFLLRNLSIDARAKGFVGCGVFSPEFGIGTLKDCAGSGRILMVPADSKITGRGVALQDNAENLLFLEDEQELRETEQSSPEPANSLGLLKRIFG